ncbi:hypothetical protein NEMIN01_0340 [Nematocida minor]|uniref:uncharacterized protein n=1 Tax=Nematocida minor TaxID=1912983 RepID=UPI002220ADEC|nr:uncharacterized protein NEMIN01_0340 [Nematocida minor]KAI5189174.1 hypothetical protein NEMIN01_0340 [Nematocida minor]
MEKIPREPQIKLAHITEVVDANIAGRLADSSIYVYGPGIGYLIGNRDKRESEYNLSNVTDRIFERKRRMQQYNSSKRNNPCNLRFSTKTWADIHKAIGSTGMIKLCTKYTVLEKVGSSYIRYFSDNFSIEPTGGREKKEKKGIVEWKDRIEKIEETKHSDIYSEEFAEYAQEIEKTLKSLKTVNTWGIISSFVKSKEKKNSVHIEPTGVCKHEIKIETVVRMLSTVIKKVFRHAVTQGDMQRIRKKIAWFLLNKKKGIDMKKIHTEFRKKLKKKAKNRDPLTYKKYITETVSYIFAKYIPYLVDIHIVVNGTGADDMRFFFKKGYRQLESAFKEACIRTHFERVEEQGEAEREKTEHSEETETPAEGFFVMSVIPKKSTFRAVYKKIYNASDKYVQIMKERMGCAILTREAEERVEWEMESEEDKKPPRARLCNSILKTQSISSKLISFKKEFKQNFEDERPLYILLLDIRSCFDNISLDIINESGLLNKLMGKREYEVFNWEDTTEDGKRRSRRVVMYPTDRTWKGDIVLKNLPPRVFRKFKSQCKFTNEDVQKMIKQDVNSTMLKHKNRFYRRVKGIYQGSRFSSQVCAYYMALLDDKIYKDLNQTRAMRYVDDSMILSWSPEELEKVLERMGKMESQYGVSLNIPKCRLFTTAPKSNCAVTINALTAVSRAKFKWCGIHFDARALSSFIPQTPRKMGRINQRKENTP